MTTILTDSNGFADPTDQTKKVKFDVSGVTTGTERTITVPNADAGFLTSDTAKASTSGTSIDFTGIPSWAKRVTVMLDGVSTNGTSNVIIQLGDSGGIEASGYTSRGSYIAGTAVSETTYTTGFGIYGGVSSNVLTGLFSIVNINSNTWICTGIIGGSATWFVAGTKSLSATLDRVRITTVNGTDAFDAGTINILYE